MSKKVVSIILSVIMCLTFILNCMATDNHSTEEELDFDTSTVLVVIKKEYSEFGKEYSPEDFNADLVESVEVINQIEKDQTDLSGYNLEYWQHILSLKLKEPSEENVEAVINSAYQNEQVESAEKNYILTFDVGLERCDDVFDSQVYQLPGISVNSTSNTTIGVEPNDTYFSRQYGLRLSRTHRAWAFAKGSTDMYVGVLDTGMNSHRDVRYDSSLSKDFTGSNHLWDNIVHGTHVAGIIGAKPNNGYGVAGCCWNVSLVNLKVMDIDPNDNTKSIGNIAWLTNAINYASSKSIKLLNLSIEYSFNTSSISASALKKAISSYNGLLICSAGNCDFNDPDDYVKNIKYPSKFTYDNIISVASIDSSSNLAASSRYSLPQVDIAAPGVSIYSTLNVDTYDYMSGTSMAAPFVTGAAALVWSVNPNLSAQQVKEYIMNNVDKVEYLSDKVVSGGRLNTLKAVLAAKGLLLGDVDMNGRVTSADARLALRCSAQLETLNQQQLVMADVNYDGVITAADARIIQQLAAHLINPLDEGDDEL